MNAITDLTVRTALQALQEESLSSVELTKAFIERIEKFEPDVHAFITFTPDVALARS